jgi:hypothetical protein
VKKFVVAAALTASLSLLSTAAGAQIVNGDFEADASATTPPTGFTVTGSDPMKTFEIQVASGQAYINGAGATGSADAAANNFVAFGGGDAANISTLSQAFSTVAGQVYNFSFDFGAFGVSTTQTLQVGLFDALSGATLATFTTADVGSYNLDTLFTNSDFNFTALSGSTRVDFTLKGSPTASVDGLLDNVSVAAVPEPATWAMMLFGFGAVGYSMRRRSNLSYAQAV